MIYLRRTHHYLLNTKMHWSFIVIIAVCFYGVGGLSKTSGIEQFWTDDHKIFEQIYGKTSDRDIYGASLPATVYQGFKPEASEKKERVHFDKDPYVDFEDDFKEVLKKSKIKSKPKTSKFNFIKYEGFKPISQSSDPETYNYLKHLEEVNDEHKDFSPKGSFKPYVNYGDTNPKHTEAYKSIQDILEAHEQNKENESEYFTSHDNNKGKKQPKIPNGEVPNRCVPGRCRKRNKIRNRMRPYVRRIKHRYY